mmetsp:Transcript_38160/g.83825  ORF Transcript_38160/g.83825 Transcript_38160/m.83825 type:complete len:82 (+) Transcript_38160:41-286(+)
MLPHAVGLISHAGAIPRTGPQAPGYSGATMVIGCIMKFAASYGLEGKTAWALHQYAGHHPQDWSSRLGLSSCAAWWFSRAS